MWHIVWRHVADSDWTSVLTGWVTWLTPGQIAGRMSCDTWTNGGVTHGPYMGYHVAPIHWSLVSLQKKLVSTSFKLDTYAWADGLAGSG
jgi:hypothetical protein